MLQIGKYNILTVAREVDHGLYLADDTGREVLLPRRYVTEGMKPGNEVKVFVYTDSDDRPVATTETPYATVGEFAFLQVRDVNATGAFLDWGLPKDLLVPFSQQKARMGAGGIYPVYVYLDDATKRVAASAKIEKFVGNVIPDYRPGTRVSALVMEHTPIGYRVIVDNLHWGMIYENELSRPLEIEQTVIASVKQVRPDGKIDLSMGPSAAERTSKLAAAILKVVERDGELTLTDASSPAEIERRFHCSKKDYKKAIGHLYKDGKILLGAGRIVAVKKDSK